MLNMMELVAQTLIVGLVLLQLEYCTTSSCIQNFDCRAGEVCDEHNCHSNQSRVDCSDGISYCYKPTTCCGISTCCPANSECCGLNSCCPQGAVCCSGPPGYCCERGTTCCGFQTCCAGNCVDGTCQTGNGSGTFKWWYAFFFILPLLSVVFVVIRKRQRAARLRAADSSLQAGQVISVPAPSEENYGYDQPMGSMAYPLPAAPGNHGNYADKPHHDENPLA